MSSREVLLGRYELRGVLGCGGMAEVREGWDTRLNRAVAVKLLHPALSLQPDIRRRFEDEAGSAAALSHPNIVSVYDCGDDDGRPFIIMERLPGDTLHDRIATGPLPPDQVRSALADVLAALSVAHSADVLHRDIKPGNILVAGDGITMKVADFGIAKTAGAAHTMTGQIIGTMAYMSPERISGAPASVGDDLYAVGVVGYEALTGRRAFPQDNPATLARAIIDAPPPSLAAVRPDLDPALAGVIDRAMARDPRRRFGSAEQMRAALCGNRTALFAGAAQAAAGRPMTKVLDEPVPVGAPGTFVAPGAPYFVPNRRRRRLSRNQKFLAAAATFVALTVGVLALATDPSSTTQVTDPVSTSSPVATPPPPPPAPQPPQPAYPPVFEDDDKGEDDKKGEERRGNGNEGNRGGGRGR